MICPPKRDCGPKRVNKAAVFVVEETGSENSFPRGGCNPKCHVIRYSHQRTNGGCATTQGGISIILIGECHSVRKRKYRLVIMSMPQTAFTFFFGRSGYTWVLVKVFFFFFFFFFQLLQVLFKPLASLCLFVLCVCVLGRGPARGQPERGWCRAVGQWLGIGRAGGGAVFLLVIGWYL